MSKTKSDNDTQSPIVPEELRQKVRSGEIKIKFASKEEVDALRPFIDRVTKAIGVRAYITDESTIRDFDLLAEMKNQSKDEWLKGLETRLGVPVVFEDFVVDIAVRLAKKEGALH